MVEMKGGVQIPEPCGSSSEVRMWSEAWIQNKAISVLPVEPGLRIGRPSWPAGSVSSARGWCEDMTNRSQCTHSVALSKARKSCPETCRARDPPSHASIMVRLYLTA
ncbi:unnamed protein product [Clonostachys rosea]|uniref:Uncharacterized protein n=1 Tax=Bionectria ochroleuca TaxID=29856 RepID=A0ABY6UGR8_BIOOC|nr:unnamed protein product [Clonostachys rosea]